MRPRRARRRQSVREGPVANGQASATFSKALGRDICYTIANDHAVMRPAIDSGVPIAEIKRKSAVGRDIDTLDAGIAAALGLER